MAIQIPIITSLEDSGIKAAKAAFNNFKNAVNNAEGGMNKFKAGSKAALDAVKANAATFAIAAGASIATFAVKAVGKFQDVALAAGELSDATGLTVEEASRLAEVAGDIGIEASSLETSIGKMNKQLGTSPKLFEELGVQVAYARDGSVDANETFLNVIDRLNGIKDPAERARVASELLGKGWQSMSELIAGGSDKLRKSLDQVSDAKVINQEELNNAREYRQNMDNLKDSFDDLAIALGQNLVPILAETVGFLADIVGLVDKALSPTGDVIAKEFGDLYDLAQAAEAAREAYIGYYDSRIRATDANRYIRDSMQETTETVYDLNIAWQRMLDTIDETRQINDVRDALDDVKEAAAEAFADPSNVREYQEAVNQLILEIAQLASTVKMTNEDQNTLKVLVDTGQLERAVKLMAIIKTGRGRVSLGEAVQAMTENELFLGTLGIPGLATGGPVSAGGTYLVGERGPELLTLGSQSGYVTPNHAIGGNMTVNVTVTSADPNAVLAALQQYVRLNNRLPANAIG